MTSSFVDPPAHNELGDALAAQLMLLPPAERSEALYVAIHRTWRSVVDGSAVGVAQGEAESLESIARAAYEHSKRASHSSRGADDAFLHDYPTR